MCDVVAQFHHNVIPHLTKLKIISYMFEQHSYLRGILTSSFWPNAIFHSSKRVKKFASLRKNASEMHVGS